MINKAFGLCSVQNELWLWLGQLILEARCKGKVGGCINRYKGVCNLDGGVDRGGGVNGFNKVARNFEFQWQKVVGLPVIITHDVTCAVIKVIIVGYAHEGIDPVCDVNSVLMKNIVPQIINGFWSEMYADDFANTKKYIIFTWHKRCNGVVYQEKVTRRQGGSLNCNHHHGWFFPTPWQGHCRQIKTPNHSFTWEYHPATLLVATQAYHSVTWPHAIPEQFPEDDVTYPPMVKYLQSLRAAVVFVREYTKTTAPDHHPCPASVCNGTCLTSWWHHLTTPFQLPPNTSKQMPNTTTQLQDHLSGHVMAWSLACCYDFTN